MSHRRLLFAAVVASVLCPSLIDAARVRVCLDWPLGRLLGGERKYGLGIDVMQTWDNPYDVKRNGVKQHHAGVDLMYLAANGSNESYNKPVYAAADGIVVCVTSPEFNYNPGRVVVIQHNISDTERIWMQYAHMQVNSVKVVVNQRVARGEELGRIDKNSDNIPHLHFEVRKFARWAKLPYGTTEDRRCAGPGYAPVNTHAGDPGNDWIDPIPYLYANRPPYLGQVIANKALAVRSEPRASAARMATVPKGWMGSGEAITSDTGTQTRDKWALIRTDDGRRGYVLAYEHLGHPARINLAEPQRPCFCPDCARCVFDARPDILPAFQGWGWDTSPGNWSAILNEWCGPTMDPSSCAAVRLGTCQSSCGGKSLCGSSCPTCILENRTDILPFYRSNGWDISRSNWKTIIDNWCGIDPAGCTAAKLRCAGMCDNPTQCTGIADAWGDVPRREDTFFTYSMCRPSDRVLECRRSGDWAVLDSSSGCKSQPHCSCRGMTDVFWHPVDAASTFCGQTVCAPDHHYYQCRTGGWAYTGGTCP
jgi:hypothetical protein